ncbi:MAG: galactokinase [bacterium]
MIQKLLERWKIEFGDPRGAKVARAPGRVNLIGEHTDYNDGYVLPYAIEHAVWIIARARPDTTIRLVSFNYNDVREACIDNLKPLNDWSDYPLGVTSIFQEEGLDVRGWDAVIGGNIPLGAGLSSSAAIEVATATALREMFHLNIDDRRLALLAQRAENKFVGVQCGIMDQFASTFGKVDHALFLDCRTLETRQIRARLGDVEIVISDTKVERGLTGSEYNTRRSQCEEAVRLLQKNRSSNIQALRDATLEDIEVCRELLPEVVYRRARHIVTENPRVLNAINALENGDIERLGELMCESHNSLRDDYEVSCPELDLLVGLALDCPGVIGSRMTGAGFGGCTVSLVQQSSLDEFHSRVAEGYEKETGRSPEITVTRPGSGAAIVDVF